MSRIAGWSFVVVLVFALGAGCSSNPNQCSAVTCARGCCDSTGVCQMAGERSACGVLGNACMVCTSSMSCVRESCVLPADAAVPGFDAGRPDSGTFAGTRVDAGVPDAGAELDAGVEVDAGVDAGPPVDAGTVPDRRRRDDCRVIPVFPAADGFSVYATTADGGREHAIGYDFGSAGPPYTSTLEIDVYWAFTGMTTGVVIPAVRRLEVEADYSTCTACVVLREQCPNLDTCARSYLGRLGTIELIDITRGVPGVIHAALTNVQLDEWRLGPDVPVVDGGCILLNSAVMNRPY
ncbi:MAG: hypothetical protein Q8L14_25935 [Myxococcales bacterium]|nr:hypothetical protein [Myxococcales bacterium]